MNVGDTLVVAALDRSLQDLITTLDDLRTCGVGFTSLHEKPGHHPGGRLVSTSPLWLGSSAN